jgi:hypothetical protein
MEDDNRARVDEMQKGLEAALKRKCDVAEYSGAGKAMMFRVGSKARATKIEGAIRKYVEERGDLGLANLSSRSFDQSEMFSGMRPLEQEKDDQTEYKVVMEPLSPLGVQGTRVLIQSMQIAYWVMDMNTSILNQYINIVRSLGRKQDEQAKKE